MRLSPNPASPAGSPNARRLLKKFAYGLRKQSRALRRKSLTPSSFQRAEWILLSDWMTMQESVVKGSPDCMLASNSAAVTRTHQSSNVPNQKQHVPPGLARTQQINKHFGRFNICILDWIFYVQLDVSFWNETCE